MTEDSPPSNVNVGSFSAEAKTARVPLGYTKLAGFMVKHDLEMFRRFRKLAVRDILYLQAELCHLDYQFQDQALRDANGGEPEKFFDREWWQLRKSGGQQWKTVLAIRTKLKEYCKWILFPLFSKAVSQSCGAISKLMTAHMMNRFCHLGLSKHGEASHTKSFSQGAGV